MVYDNHKGESGEEFTLVLQLFYETKIISKQMFLNDVAGWIMFSPKTSVCWSLELVNITFSSVHSVESDSLRPHGLQHTRLLCPSSTPGACSSSYPLTWWCHPTISSSAIPFSSHIQSFPESGSFPMSQFFTSGGQSIGASASASVFPMNIQDWFPLGWTGWISLKSKGLSRVFSNTEHQFFRAQLFYSPTLTSTYD